MILDDSDPLMGALFAAGRPDLLFKPRLGTLPAAAVRKALSAAAASLAPVAALSPSRRRVLKGVALLWHDCWKEAHEIAQAREGESDFDLLHAIGHRREGDYPNSGYWSGSAGKHPCYAIIAERLAAPGFADARSLLMPDGEWSPQAFLSEVKRHAGAESETRRMLVRVQAVELLALADWTLHSG